MLLNECSDAGVDIRCSCTVSSVEKSEYFEVQTNQGTFAAPSLVIASGGLSIKPLGASDFGYRIAKQFKVQIEPPRAGLVPFTLDPELLNHLNKLSGISLDAEASFGGTSFRENILVTHRGLSGPAVLQISSYWQPGKPVSLNLLPETDASELLLDEDYSSVELSTLLSQRMPKRFAQAWCELFAPSKQLKKFNRRELGLIASKLHNFQITPSGTEGFKKAEVTVGGVSTNELSSQTMTARKVSGLYFIGEVVDVTGHLGGFNFQWAWASGYAAGTSV